MIIFVNFYRIQIPLEPWLCSRGWVGCGSTLCCVFLKLQAVGVVVVMVLRGCLALISPFHPRGWVLKPKLGRGKMKPSQPRQDNVEPRAWDLPGSGDQSIGTSGHWWWLWTQVQILWCNSNFEVGSISPLTSSNSPRHKEGEWWLAVCIVLGDSNWGHYPCWGPGHTGKVRRLPICQAGFLDEERKRLGGGAPPGKRAQKKEAARCSFFSPFIVLSGVHCGIYTGSYNESNVS
jgi:hypothetical protein